MTTKAERARLRDKLKASWSLSRAPKQPANDLPESVSIDFVLSLLDEADELERIRTSRGYDLIDAPPEEGHYWYEHEPGCLEVALVRRHQGRLRFLLASFADYFDIPNLEGERWWGPKIPEPEKKP